MDKIYQQAINYRITKDYKAIELTNDLLIKYDNKEIIDIYNLVLILNECLISTWWLNKKDISLKCAKIIEKHIYDYSFKYKQANIINNLSYHGIKIKHINNVYLSYSTNYGDTITQYMLENIFNIKINVLNDIYNVKNHYITMGSICSYANKYTTIWGSGSIKDIDIIPNPQKVLCVRGPLTRAKMIMQSIECPKKYGDPAILLPLMYQCKSDEIYDYGFVPHYIDRKHKIFNNFVDNKYTDKNGKKYLFMDIETGDDPEFLINEYSKCKTIISSSLHGVIVAAVYKKPVIWITLSDKVIGGTFKFYDFYESLNYNSINKRLDISKFNDISDVDNLDDHKIIVENQQLYNRAIDLLTTNPFSSDIDQLVDKIKEYWQI